MSLSLSPCLSPSRTMSLSLSLPLSLSRPMSLPLVSYVSLPLPSCLSVSLSISSYVSLSLSISSYVSLSLSISSYVSLPLPFFLCLFLRYFPLLAKQRPDHPECDILLNVFSLLSAKKISSATIAVVLDIAESLITAPDFVATETAVELNVNGCVVPEPTEEAAVSAG